MLYRAPEEMLLSSTPLAGNPLSQAGGEGSRVTYLGARLRARWKVAAPSHTAAVTINSAPEIPAAQACERVISQATT